MKRLEDLVGSDLGKQRKIKKYKDDFDSLQNKWAKNKQDFKTNANTSKAVVVQNSLR